MESNKEYVEAVVSQKLYDKANQSINEPADFQIRKISQILSLTEMVKYFWIKARLKITDSDQRLYFLASPSCSRTCGAAFKYEFTCLYCNHDFSSPKPLLRFQAELFDGTGTLHAYVEHKEAKMLLGMSGEEIIETEQEGKQFSLDDINQKFKDLHFLFHIRTSKNEFRGRTSVRNTIITCLPSSESSSASHSSEDNSSSSYAQKNLRPDVHMFDSQASTSKIPDDHLPRDLFEHQSSSTGKRRLDPREETTQESLKHTKQD